MDTLQQDTYFLNSAIALYYAARNFDSVCNGTSTELHICYCNLYPSPNAPINLVYLPLNKFNDFFIQTSLPVPTLINTEGSGTNDTSQYETAFEEMRRTVAEYREVIIKDSAYVDTYFADRQIALLTALQQNRTKTTHPTISGLQICYYDGDPIPEAPENLIHLPFNKLADFLSTTRLRYPKKIYIPVDMDREISSKLLLAFRNSINMATNHVSKQTKIILDKIKTEAPPKLDVRKPLRFFIPASRLTTVMQYSSSNIAKALQKAGQEAMLSVELNEMEDLTPYHHLRAYHEFSPNVTININHLNNHYIHDDVVNIVWWQDPMPELLAGKLIKYRANDIHMAESKPLETLLLRCGVHSVSQRFCIDDDVFYNKKETREDKIVFIGGSYHSKFSSLSKNEQIAVEKLKEDFSNGVFLSPTHVDQVADKYNISRDAIQGYALSHVLRDMSVRALCAQNKIKFELYGYDWEYDPIFSTHYHGKLKHGEDVARIYNGSKYALVCLPGQIQTQRLIEAAACGCIPVVYDTRSTSEKPHWDNHCIFYLGTDDLENLDMNIPMSCPTSISRGHTYNHLANRLVQLVVNHQQLT